MVPMITFIIKRRCEGSYGLVYWYDLNFGSEKKGLKNLSTMLVDFS